MPRLHMCYPLNVAKWQNGKVTNERNLYLLTVFFVCLTDFYDV